MSDELSTRASNVEVAKNFYRHHELAFRQAAAEQTTVKREFVFSADQFDDWAVTIGYMTKRARDTDSLERGGALYERHKLRMRLNRAAHKGHGLDRAYSIEARGQKWRVVLLERFITEQPRMILSKLRSCYEGLERTGEQTIRLVDEQEHLSGEERLSTRTNVETALMMIYGGYQTLEMINIALDSENQPNLKYLRRKMTKFLMHEANRGQKKRRIHTR